MNEKRLNSLKNAISAKIAKTLEEKGWRQQELADRMELPKSNVSRILSGEANLTISTIVKIEGILGKRILKVEP